MRHIARLLRAHQKVTASGVAFDFECDRKTIARDLTFMRDRLGWNFEWLPRTGTYRLTKAPEGEL